MKKTALRALSILLAAAVLLGSSAPALEGLKEEDDNFFVSTDPQYAKLVDRVRKNAHSNSFTGSILIATDDAVILFSGPRALTREGLPVDPHTTYNIGSCSKLFTAVAVFQLIEKGLLSPGDPLTRFFPAYETGREITLRHLLHMQSGIADYVNDPEHFWVKTDWQDGDAFIRRLFGDQVSDAELLENLYAAPLDFAPGTEQRYSNTNYVLLAMIVEQVTGQRFCDYLQANVFDVCGLEHTTAMTAGNETSVPRTFQDLFAAGVVDENGYVMTENGDRGAGGIHTCLMDLWAFDRALLSGQLVSGASLAEIRNFEMDYGCGLYPYAGKAYGHSGRDGTYTTQNIIIETEDFGRIYFIASTASDAGSYGLGTLMQAVFSQLRIY